jgi:hypothetical protein
MKLVKSLKSKFDKTKISHNNRNAIIELQLKVTLLEHILLKKHLVTSSDDLTDRCFVNFKSQHSQIPNDLLPATVTPYKDKLFIQWDNGFSAVSDFNDCNFINIS